MKATVLRLIIIFFIVVFAVFYLLNFVFFNKDSTPKSKAAVDSVNLTFEPNTLSLPDTTQTKVITIKGKPTKNLLLRGYWFVTKFDKTKIQVTKIEYLFLGGVSGLADQNADLERVNSQGKILSVVNFSAVEGRSFPSNSNTALVRLTVKSKDATGAGSDLTIDKDSMGFFHVRANATMENLTETAVTVLPINGGSTPPGGCVGFSDNFSSTTLNTNNWTLWTNNNGTIATSSGKLTLNLPVSTDANSKSVSIYSKNISNVDFSAEVLFNSITTASGKKAATQYLNFHNQADARFFNIARVSSGSGELSTTVHNTVNGGYEQEVKSISVANTSPVKVVEEVVVEQLYRIAE